MASDVEQVALQYEHVELAKAEAKPNPITGQHVELTVQSVSNGEVDKVCLKTFLAAQLPSHMMPKRIRVASVSVGHRFRGRDSVISFREIEIEDAKTVLNWRTSERVTKFMNSDMKYDIDAQKRWLEGSFSKPSYYHWIIQYSGKDVGLLNFVDWNKEERTTSWGFYR